MTHDFRPGDVVRWGPDAKGSSGQSTITHVGDGFVMLMGHGDRTFNPRDLRLHATAEDMARAWKGGPPATPTEHPSRARAASSLRAASASLTTAIDHLTRAGEPETYPGQTVIRIRTASEETQACIQHATMALYWLLHERLS